MNLEQLKRRIKLIDTLTKAAKLKENQLVLTTEQSQYYSKYQFMISTDKYYFHFKLSPSPTGCGVMMLSGISDIANNEDKSKICKAILDELFKEELKNVGLLIATFGYSFYTNYVPNLVNILGFTEIVEYSNPNMNNNGQKVFIKKINQIKDFKETPIITQVAKEVVKKEPKEVKAKVATVITRRIKEPTRIKTSNPIGTIEVKPSRRSTQVINRI